MALSPEGNRGHRSRLNTTSASIPTRSLLPPMAALTSPPSMKRDWLNPLTPLTPSCSPQGDSTVTGIPKPARVALRKFALFTPSHSWRCIPLMPSTSKCSLAIGWKCDRGADLSDCASKSPNTFVKAFSLFPCIGAHYGRITQNVMP
jgi:hypothetical protein